MQALSQLSYGPTLLLRARYSSGVFTILEEVVKTFSQRVSSAGGWDIVPVFLTKTRYLYKKTRLVVGFPVPDEWRPHGDSNPGRHRERVMS